MMQYTYTRVCTCTYTATADAITIHLRTENVRSTYGERGRAEVHENALGIILAN